MVTVPAQDVHRHECTLTSEKILQHLIKKVLRVAAFTKGQGLTHLCSLTYSTELNGTIHEIRCSISKRTRI